MLLAAAIATGTVAIAAGCSLSWEVRPAPADGSTSEASLPDVAVTDTSPVDAGEDAPAEAESDAACTYPSADLAAKRKAARMCTLGNGTDCKVSVKDECNCDVPVRTAGSVETTAYSSAVADWVAACGTSQCPKDCPTLAPSNPSAWACLQPDGTIHCTP